VQSLRYPNKICNSGIVLSGLCRFYTVERYAIQALLYQECADPMLLKMDVQIGHDPLKDQQNRDTFFSTFVFRA
jgi:hypothetical protein